MQLFPKIQLEWIEPEAFVKKRYYKERSSNIWWHDILLVTISVVIFMTGAILASRNPENKPPSIDVCFIIAFLGSLTLVYILPWMFRFSPSKIRFFQKRLVILAGTSPRSLVWADFDSFSFNQDQGFSVLELVKHKGKKLELGLAPNIRQDAIKIFLLDMGLVNTPPQPK